MKKIQCHSIGYGNAQECAINAESFTSAGLVWLAVGLGGLLLVAILCQKLGL